MSKDNYILLEMGNAKHTWMKIYIRKIDIFDGFECVPSRLKLYLFAAFGHFGQQSKPSNVEISYLTNIAGRHFC